MYCGTQLNDNDRFCHKCGKPCVPQPQQHQPQYQTQTQYSFSEDWNRFFDKLDSYLSSRQNFEKEYNSICRKAKNQEYDNPNSSACFYYMAAVLCYFYYDEDSNISEDEKILIFGMGESAIKTALSLLKDEEFFTMSLVYELIGLQRKIIDSSSTPEFVYKKLQSIKQTCPPVESIENTLIKNEALREWFNNAYYEVLLMLLVLEREEMEANLELKAQCATELKNSSGLYDQMVAYAYLADALFDMGKYSEAQRYAVLGKDLLGTLPNYDNDDSTHFYWGMCWCIYARCQEEAGEMEYAMTLIEKGASLGIPWCVKELERLKQNNRMKKTEKLDGGMSLTEQERKEYAGRINSQFSMEIEDVWELEKYPQSLMAIGRVWSGRIKSGEAVVVVDGVKRQETTVFGVGMFDKKLDVAEAGDACGIMLQSIDAESLHPGSVIYKLSEFKKKQ